jgi:hypothetical protein
MTPPVKPQWVRYKLGETIEQSSSDVLGHTPEVSKGAHLYNEYLATQDGHDSWGMCTTSTECKTVLTAVLMFMSGMDPHMIRWKLRSGGFLACQLVLDEFCKLG